MAQTLDQFRTGLSDPNFAVAFMVQNNPEGIADNLRNMGLVVSSPHDIVEALNGFLEAGDDQAFKDALNVPVVMERITPDELAVLGQQVPAMVRAAGGQAKSFDVNALFAGLATGTLYYLNQTGQTRVEAGPAVPPAAPKQDNSTMYIIGGIVLVVIIVAIILLRKK